MARAGPVILHAMLGAGFGGLEQVFLDDQPILERLAAAQGGYAVALARRGGEAARRAAAQGAAAPGPATQGGRLELAAAYSDWDPISLASVRAVVRRHRPSLAVVHGQRAYRLLARTLPRATPIVAVIHKPSFDVDLVRTSYVCVGEHLAQAVRARGVPAERVRFVPNAVRLDGPRAHGRQPGGTPVIVAGGRLHAKKGFDVLIRAMALLREAGVQAACRIAGEGPERARLEGLVAELGLGGRVTLAGWRDDLPAFLAEGDVFAFPSHQEGFPLGLLQAMAAGLPIVSSAIDGPNEMLDDGVSGLLVPDADPRALADALAALLADPARAARLAAAARAAVERDYGPEALERRLGQALASTGVFDGIVSPP
ncbi:MAG: glycosyltransferase [Caulobacteraceae bacterium]|nr:glycosyltransferase [Caulobacteraceae bacterium]